MEPARIDCGRVWVSGTDFPDVPSAREFVHSAAVPLIGGKGPPSTGNPHVGIAVRTGQKGRKTHSYPQCYSQVSSTSGDDLGIRATSVKNCDVCGQRAGKELGGSRLGLDARGQVGHLVEQGPPFGHQLPDLPVGMHHRGVVAASEGLSDLR